MHARAQTRDGSPASLSWKAKENKCMTCRRDTKVTDAESNISEVVLKLHSSVKVLTA